MTGEWWRPLRDLNDRYYAGPRNGIRWGQHVEGLNRELGLQGNQALSTFPKADLPPAWFIGDVTSVVPGEWALVFSLNPAADDDAAFYAGREWDAGRFWEYQTGWLREWWNPRFHGPLAGLVARSVGRAGIEDAEALQRFAAECIVFAELCPYASKQFALSAEVLQLLRERDVACRIEAEMTDRMLREGAPRVVLVNGNRAIEHFETRYGSALSWELRQYESEAKPGKTLWHMEGTLQVGDRVVPTAGFPFLKKPATHNFRLEIEQLGRSIAGRVEAVTEPLSGEGLRS